MGKRENLTELYNEYAREFEGEEIVTGDGNIDARIVLIGEAPGKDEVRLQKPFVGMAGKNLDDFLEILCLKREEIYITNAIKYRLSRINPKSGRIVNRPATKKEIVRSRQYLVDEVNIISPEYIVTLGNTPLNSIFPEAGEGIGKLHGKVLPLILDGKSFKLFPAYHPASIIYNRNLKDIYIADLKKLKKILGLSCSL